MYLGCTYLGRMDKWPLVGHNVVVARGSLLQVALGAAAGAFVWTATEYSVHRWVLHGPFGTGKLKKVPIGSMHRAHHRDPEETSLVMRTAGHLSLAAVAGLASVPLSSALPAVAARAMAATWSLGYSSYEINHWNYHHRPARTALGQRLRDRHHQHHFGAPRSNLGVTMTFWDHLLGTEAPGSPADG